VAGSRRVDPGNEPEPLPPESWALSDEEPQFRGPAPRLPAQGGPPPGKLDMSKDPDRFDPVRDALAPQPKLDPAKDPDRYRPPGAGQTLPGILGDGAQEDTRDNMVWALGLLAMVCFLLLVALLFGGF
jgi:hypothetical protein